MDRLHSFRDDYMRMHPRNMAQFLDTYNGRSIVNQERVRRLRCPTVLLIGKESNEYDELLSASMCFAKDRIDVIEVWCDEFDVISQYYSLLIILFLRTGHLN